MNKSYFPPPFLKCLGVMGIALLLAMLSPNQAISQVPHDNCSDAKPILCNQGGVDFIFNTANYNNDGPPLDCNGGSTGPDVWFTFVGDGTTLQIQTVGGSTEEDFDTKIDVYTGTCGALVSVSCNDNAINCACLQSRAGVNTIPGVTYYYRVYGANGTTGLMEVSTGCNAPTPPSNDNCGNAPTIACGSTTSGTTTNATTNGVPATDCNGGTPAPDVWYNFVGTGGTITASLCGAGTNYDTKLDVYTGGCGTPICVGGNDNGNACGLASLVTWPSVLGTTYLIRVHGNNGETGNFALNLTCTDPAPSNDNCGSALTVTCGSTSTGSTVNATVDGPASDCAGGSVAADVWYNIVGTGANITASLCGAGTDYDSQIDVYTGDCGSLVCIGGNDDGCNIASVFAWSSVAGTLYRIRVHGFAGDTGNFTLNMTCADPAPVLNCPTNTTVAECQTQAAVNAQFAAWLATASGTGGCNGVLTNNNTGAPPACGGSTTVTFTYTSTCAPLTTTCQATFTVPSQPLSEFVCATNTVVGVCQTQAAVNAQFAAWLATTIASGGCNGVLTNNNTGAPSACGGSTTVTFTYTRSCAPLTTTCTATFTVASSTAVLNCPPATTASACLTQAQLNTAYANWLASATVSGGCGGGILTNNAPAAPLICNPNSNTITVMFTFSGATCQTANVTCSSTFTVPAYPTITVPANGANTVACPALIVQPTPPTLVDGCGRSITPTGPVIVNAPNPITCEGTRTFTWTYTDCAGTARTWSHVYTIERQPFTVPVNGAATVDCPDDTDVAPVPPVVTSNCGEVLTPVRTVNGKPLCEGTRTYTFTYTDCEGNTANWQFAYTIEYEDFITPASIVEAVECPVNAILPTPPVVNDNCGNLLVPVGPSVTRTSNAQGCEASRKYEWIYTDCEGNSHAWSQTFLFEYNGDFFAPLDEENYVTCLAYAVKPVPQTLYDYCGLPIAANFVSVTQDIAPGGCTGWRKYSFVYTDCGGHSHPWNFTYYINDNEGPLGTCPSDDAANGGNNQVSVSVRNLACIEDVPCPDDYDFMPKVEELLAAGNYYDGCDGDNVIVTLDSWSELWECADPDGDGDYTFGRTFYFRIADKCGNEAATRCEVTYSGACQPLRTFPQQAWGIEGDEPANAAGATSDLSVITTLLGNTPIAVGGINRSITLNSAQSVMNLLPGTGGPALLSNCQQVNSTGPNGASCNPMGIGGMKNALAANAIALELNIRYNMQYAGLTRSNIRNQGLACIPLHPCIYTCTPGGDCSIHVFDAQGVEHTADYTLGGLQDLANLYLNGGLDMTVGQKTIYGTALNQSLLGLNAYYGDAAAAACGGSLAPDFGEVDRLLEEYGLTPSSTPDNDVPVFELMPNPASTEVTVKLAGIAEGQAFSLELFNSIGQKMLQMELGEVSNVNERLDLSGFSNGLYFVKVKVGESHFERKLFVGK